MITRHAERLPSGELSPEGIEHAKQKGAIVKGAEGFKGLRQRPCQQAGF